MVKIHWKSLSEKLLFNPFIFCANILNLLEKFLIENQG